MLSSPLVALRRHYVFIVIGSGYGGSITASRMARAGRKVCLLEKGRAFQPGEFPRTAAETAKETQIDTSLGALGKKTGLFDVSANKDINVVRGCGLGGTSLNNANVGMEPDTRVLDNPCWPPELQKDRELSKKCFRNADDMLNTKPYPDKEVMPAKAAWMKFAAEKPGVAVCWSFTPVYVNFTIHGPNHVGVAQKPCIGFGDCCTGCNFQAKSTTNMNYLPDAKNHGAEIYTGALVRFVEKRDLSWLVHYTMLDGEGKPAGEGVLGSEIVVLAAGTLGTTEIMLRSRDYGLGCSSLLGQHFSGNGDFLAFGNNNIKQANAIGAGKKFPPPGNPADTPYRACSKTILNIDFSSIGECRQN